MQYDSDLTDEERVVVKPVADYLIENRREFPFLCYLGVKDDNVRDYLHSKYQSLFNRRGRPRDNSGGLFAEKYPEMVSMCSKFREYPRRDPVRVSKQIFAISRELKKRIGYLGTIAFGPRYTLIARDSTCPFLDDICYGKSMYIRGSNITWTNGICDQDPEEHEYMGGYFYLTRFTRSSLDRHNEFLKNNNVDPFTSKRLMDFLRHTVIRTLVDTDGSRAANNVKDTRDIVMSAFEPSLAEQSRLGGKDFDMSKYYRYVELAKNDIEELDYLCKLAFGLSTPFINPIHFDE